MFACGDVEIGHVVVNEAIGNIGLKNAIELARKEHSDLIAGKYEGKCVHYSLASILTAFLAIIIIEFLMCYVTCQLVE